MSQKFIANVIRGTLDVTAVAATDTARELVEAIKVELKKEGTFTLPGFGTLRVAKTKARTGLNPKTGEKLKIKAGKTVRFKASPVLKAAV